MNLPVYRLLRSYGIAMGSTAIALSLTLLLQPLLGQTISPFFSVAITLVTWHDGLRPRLVATFLSTVAINIFGVSQRGDLANSLINDAIC